MPGDRKNDDETLRRFEAVVSGEELADLHELVRVRRDPADWDSKRPKRPTLRRRRRDQVAIYRLRVDLDDSRPPIWRRLDVRSDLTLDVFHHVLQDAFDWTNSHLHRFSLGGGPFDEASEWFLCPYDAQEGEEEGVPAAQVRLDEVLQEPGDALRYLYDYGDTWDLTVRLEQVLPAADDAASAVCVDGLRAAPPEDCGGITTAEELAVVLDDPARFSTGEVNAALRRSFYVLFEAGVDRRLLELVDQLQFTPVGADVSRRVSEVARAEGEPSTEDKAAALRAHLWFLDRAADGGIQLTAAGYLKPADVQAVAPLVPEAGFWIGSYNREADVYPLLHLRESLRRMGLLRKSQGRLQLTKAGAAAQGNPEVLWRHLATRLIPPKADRYTVESSLIVLAYAATSPGVPVPLAEIAEVLAELDWRRGYQFLDSSDVYHVAALAALRNISTEAVTDSDPAVVSPVAAVLARTVLLAGVQR